MTTIRLYVAIVWVLVIMLLCWLPGQYVQKVESSSSWFEIHHFDKAVHCGIFVVFAVLWARVRPSWRGYVLAGVLGIGLAVLSELGQLVPAVRRDSSIADGATDVLGCVIGLALAPLLEPVLRMIEAFFFRSSDARRT